MPIIPTDDVIDSHKVSQSIGYESFQMLEDIPYYRKLTMHVNNADFKNSRYFYVC